MGLLKLVKTIVEKLLKLHFPVGGAPETGNEIVNLLRLSLYMYYRREGWICPADIKNKHEKVIL